VNPVLVNPRERRVSLDGTWQFRLDPEDKGIQSGWSDLEAFEDQVQVPGCWQGQGLGGEEEEEVWDFRLWARTLKATYRGTGWYARRFTTPRGWSGSRIWLNFGGVHPSADVWVNGEKVASHSGPFVPFASDITDLIKEGGDNLVVIRVHEADRWLGLAYNWQGSWSGLYRSVELSATGPS
jgi:beta-galactosidase/beta-glucuronidase